MSALRLEPKQEHRTPIRRFDAIFGGPIWWAMHLGATYWLVPRACGMGSNWMLHVWTVLMVALCGRAALSALQVMKAGEAAGDAVDARRDVYLGWMGLFFSIFFGAVTLFEGIPAWFHSPCY
ncbi:hypothetical protein FTX61_00965 [Nitriliruptoraceae bacterium ZYF776]|nr:hypothetical protein [Profundirhabdus halotolerans]